MKTLERKYSRSERIVAKAKFSSAVYLWSIILAAILGGIIAVVWTFNVQIEGLFVKGTTEAQYLTDDVMRYVVLGAGIAVLLSFLLQSISLYAKELIVTEDKIVFRFGVLAVRNVALPIVEIVIIESNQNLIQRIFNTGSLMIISDAEAPYKVSGVRAPERLSRRIMKQVSDVRRQNETRRLKLELK